jgi:integrase
MPMGNSTRNRRASTSRPEKPYETFPLYAHPLGYWSKKVGGQIKHFGRWGRVVQGVVTPVEDQEKAWNAALALFDQEHGAVRDGAVKATVVAPSAPEDAEPTIRLVANRFLTAKMHSLESGELAARTFREYKEGTDLLVSHFGKYRKVRTLKPSDFEELRAEMAKNWGPARLGKFVQIIRMIFGHAADNDVIDTVVRFGSEFKRPSKKTFRKQKREGGKKLFTAAEIHTILAALAGDEVTVVDKRSGRESIHRQAANLPLRAGVLLAVNAGLGNSDISGLKFEHLEERKGWLEYERPKTQIDRRTPLWKETAEAIKAAIKVRPVPRVANDEECVFLNRRGGRLVQSTTTSHSDYVSKQFGKLLRNLKINGRKNLNFYGLRHTHATVALETGDRDTCLALMGHTQEDMISQYDELGPSDQRRQGVVQHIHEWLFAT